MQNHIIHKRAQALVQILAKRFFKMYLTKPAITCSKLTIETLEQSVKYVKTPKRRQWRQVNLHY